jgi:ketosteroid isomerase-like protein
MTKESTTPDLEEKVRQAREAGNRRDFDAALAIWAPDAVWELSPIGMGVVEAGHLVGHEAIQEFWEALTAPYEDFETVGEEFRNLGHGVTFVVVLQRGRPAGSSGFVELRYAGVGIWRDGLVERYTTYTDIDQARATAEQLAEERG